MQSWFNDAQIIEVVKIRNFNKGTKVKFQVFKDGKLINEFNLHGAYLFGSDGIAIRRAEIKFNNGFIFCKKPTFQTAGLSLLWPVDGFGSVLMPTTCLPERDRPYILNVEIARAKLMQIVDKREEWSLFNGTDEPTEIAKEAQDLFIQAIQNIFDAPLASKLADESLKRAIVVAENMAIKQAESLLEMRIKSHGFGRGCLGCLVDPKQINNQQYLKRVLDLSGFATIPINWAQIEKQQGTYRTRTAGNAPTQRASVRAKKGCIPNVAPAPASGV